MKFMLEEGDGIFYMIKQEVWAGEGGGVMMMTSFAFIKGI